MKIIVITNDGTVVETLTNKPGDHLDILGTSWEQAKSLGSIVSDRLLDALRRAEQLEAAPTREHQ